MSIEPETRTHTYTLARVYACIRRVYTYEDENYVDQAAHTLRVCDDGGGDEARGERAARSRSPVSYLRGAEGTRGASIASSTPGGTPN